MVESQDAEINTSNQACLILDQLMILQVVRKTYCIEDTKRYFEQHHRACPILGQDQYQNPTFESVYPIQQRILHWV